MYKFTTSILSTILALASISATADAANFIDRSFGISIDVDDALTKQPLMRDTQSFASQDMSGSLVIRRAYDLSIIDFVDHLRQVGYRDSRQQVTLRINGEPFEADIESGLGLLIPVQGHIGGQPLTGIIGAYSGHSGQGFLVIGTAKPESWSQWNPRMQAMFESVKFVEVDPVEMVKIWQDWLKGKKLQYKQTNITSHAPAGMPGMYYGGSAMQKNYHLCSDGTVIRKSASAGQATAQEAGQSMMAYGQAMNQGRGTWHVALQKGELFLIVRDGPEQGLKMEQEGDTFLLDSMPYYVTDSDLCQ